MISPESLAKLEKLKVRLQKKEERRAKKNEEKTQATVCVEEPKQELEQVSKVMKTRGLVSFEPVHKTATVDKDGFITLDMSSDDPEHFLAKIREQKRLVK